MSTIVAMVTLACASADAPPAATTAPTNCAPFGPAVASLPIESGEYAHVFAHGDVDCDGLEDLLVGESRARGTVWDGRVSVWRSLGDGRFIPTQTLPSGGIAHLLVADFDGNGAPDVVASERFGVEEGRLAFFRGGCSAGLAQPTEIALPADHALFDFETADFDGDGFPDLVLAALRPSSGVSVVHGGARPFTRTSTNVVAESRLAALTAGDLDGDGAPDVLLLEAPGPTLLARVVRNAGHGRMIDAGETALLPFDPESVRLVDVDGDGLGDLVGMLDRQDGSPRRLQVLFGDGAGVFSEPQTLLSTPGPLAFVTGEQGHRFDLVALRPSSATIVRMGRDHGVSLLEVPSPLGERALLFDATGDGRLDLVFAADDGPRALLGRCPVPE